jgi:hypothetical protein
MEESASSKQHTHLMREYFYLSMTLTITMTCELSTEYNYKNNQRNFNLFCRDIGNSNRISIVGGAVPESESWKENSWSEYKGVAGMISARTQTQGKHRENFQEIYLKESLSKLHTIDLI